MIKSKKLIAVVAVLTMLVSMFSGMTVSAATVPAAGLSITYNTSESTTTNLVFDVTTDAEYLASASIVWDISAIWTSISGNTFILKGNTINAASSFGTSVAQNVADMQSTAKVACLGGKKVKIQLAAATTAAPFDFTSSNVIAKVVIPLTAPITASLSLAVDAAATFLTPGVVSDDPNTVTGFDYAEQYLNAGAMTVNSANVAVTLPASVTVAEVTTTGTTRAWNVTAPATLWNAGSAYTASLYNVTKADTDTQTVTKDFDGSFETGATDVTVAVKTTLDAANSADVLGLKFTVNGTSGQTANYVG